MEIFLVDDDDVFNCMNIAVIEWVMKEAEVKVFKSGMEVIAYLNREKQIGPAKGLMLLDIRMPDMDGFEMLANIEKMEKNPLPNTIIYMLSSTLDERDLQRAKEKKMVKGFLSKPLTVEKFRELLWENALVEK